MAAKRERARRFVVGYGGPFQDVVWGKRAHLPSGDSEYDIQDFCHRMTMLEARKAAKAMPSAGAVDYELVERS